MASPIRAQQTKRRLPIQVLGVLALVFPLSSVGCLFDSGSYMPEPDSRVWSQVLKAADPRYAPQWTPDGNGIVFGFPEARGAIYVAASDGSSVRRITPSRGGLETEYSPDISPDGSQIVYTASRHPGDAAIGRRNFEIETSGLDGSDRLRLTANSDLDASPVWSPDGSRIAFAKHSSGFPHFTGIYTMALDGSDLRQIVPDSESEKWEDAGDVLVVTGGRNPTTTTGRYHETGPRWSPDGNMLAFVISEDLRERNEHGHYLLRKSLYLVGADGAGLTRLFVNVGGLLDYDIGVPQWSPDGKTIAFAVLDKTESPNPLRLHVYVINPDGTGLREIVEHEPEYPEYLGPGPSLSWSPDGSRIAIVNVYYAEEGANFLSTIAVDGLDLLDVARIDGDNRLEAGNGS